MVTVSIQIVKYKKRMMYQITDSLSDTIRLISDESVAHKFANSLERYLNK